MLGILLFVLVPALGHVKCGIGTINHTIIELPVNTANERKLFTMNKESEYEPIRIYVYYGYLDVPEAIEDYLKNHIVRGAVEWYQNTIKTKRIKDKLVLSNYKGYDCHGIKVPEKHAEEGVEADFMVYLSVSELNPSVAGWSTICFLQEGRPALGRLHLEARWLDQMSFEDSLSTAIHELAHTLVFAPGLYNFWVKPDGQRYTSDEMFLIENTRGITVYKLKTPKVKEKAEKNFGCSELGGVELESSGGSGTAGAHWEKRVMYGDFMVADSNMNDIVYSDITMAMFEDSGWYQVDYSYTSKLLWGYKEGCSFFSEKCLSNGEPNFEEFCSDFSETTHCDYKHLHKGACNIMKFSSELPQEFQYFSEPTYGGADQYLDYCPIIKQVKGGNCRGLELHETLLNPDYGEKACENCRCIEGTYGKSKGDNWHAGCHEVKCEGNKPTIYIGESKVTCFSSGEEVEVPGFKGFVKCPESDILCREVPCPNNCSGLGKCQDGVCICPDGTKGSDCSNLEFEPSSSCLLELVWGIMLTLIL